MRRVFNINSYLLVFMGLTLFYSSVSQAVVTCTRASYRADNLALIPVSITAGSDLPLGSTLYDGRWREDKLEDLLACTSPNPTDETGLATYTLGIESAPYPLSSWSGSPFGGHVYTTNVPGIGVAVWYNDAVTTTHTDPIREPENITVRSSVTYFTRITGFDFDISLIKIGPTPPGDYIIQSSSLPVIKLFFKAVNNVSGFPITVRNISLSGELKVIAGTCLTPDVNVNLGTHDISSLTNIGSATPWVNSDITLTNCPTFEGYYGSDNYVQLSAGTVPASTKNQFGVTLTPTSNILDAANGIMSLAPETTSATGVGIQVAQGTTSTTNPIPFNFNSEIKTTLSRKGNATVIFPLVSRYIKTSPHVTPGPADGKLTFTISYY